MAMKLTIAKLMTMEKDSWVFPEHFKGLSLTHVASAPFLKECTQRFWLIRINDWFIRKQSTKRHFSKT